MKKILVTKKKERIRIRSLILDVIKAVLHKRKPQQISLRVGEGGVSLESGSQKREEKMYIPEQNSKSY